MWDEVRRLNAELGITIFLTTQYLEEADALADRVGIISRGRLVAEGPPEALKHSIGSDLIVIEVEGDGSDGFDRLRRLDGVDSVTVEDGGAVVSTPNGSKAMGPVAMELAGVGLQVRSLVLRTPTLDDVFRELTGSHIAMENQDR